MNSYVEQRLDKTEKKYFKISGCRYISKEEYAKIMQPTSLTQIRINNNGWLKKRDEILDYAVRIMAALIACVLLLIAGPKMYNHMYNNYTYDKCLKQANKYISDIKYEEAVKVLEEGMTLEGVDITELVLLNASVHTYMNKYDEAIDMLSEVHASYPDARLSHKIVEIEKAQSIYEYEKYMADTEDVELGFSTDDRMSLYTKAIDAKPDEYRPYLCASEIYISEREFDKAINLLQSGIDLCEGMNTELEKSTYYELTGEMEKIYKLVNTREYYETFLEVEEACKKSEIELITQKYEEARKLNYRDVHLYITVANAYTRENKYTDAISVLNQGIKALSVYKNNSKLSKNYNSLINLRTKLLTISKYVSAYSKNYAKMYSVCKNVAKTKDFTKLEEILLTNNYKTMAISSRTTYYNSLGKFVDTISKGSGMAVYNNQYIYYGNFRNGLKHGKGYYVACSYEKGNVVTYSYVGEWNNDYPSGEGKITYIVKQKGKVIYKTVTKGTFKKGYENGKMSIIKMDSSRYNGEMLKLNYTAEEGVIKYLKNSDGEVQKTSEGNKIIGYYYLDSKKKEVVATKDDLIWRVQGLTY